MGILIIGLALLLIAITLHIIGNKIDKELPLWISLISYIVAGIVVVVVITCLICAKCSNHRIKIKYETLHNNYMERIENWKNGDISDAQLWHDVTEYNKEIENGKYWRQNFWTNILNEKCYLEFEQIEIPDYVEK